MEVIFTLLLAFVCTTFNVWLIHWILHRPWIIKYYSNHLEHHTNGREDYFLFSRISIPFLIVITLLGFIGIYSMQFMIINLICTIFWIGLHDLMHYLYHVGKFKKLKTIHTLHHLDYQSNYGIFFFGWDKMFKTFRSK